MRIARVETAGVKTTGIYLPAHMVTSGWGIPPLCVRDGRPAPAGRRITFVSKTPAWVYVFILLGLGIALLVMLVVRKRIKAPAWPVCADCLRLRRRRIMACWLLLVGGPVLAAVLANMVGSGDGKDVAFGLILLLGFACCPLAGIVVGSQASLAWMFKASVDPTGASVNFREPALAFVQALPGVAASRA